MSLQSKALIGSWMQAIGTITSAMKNNPSTRKSKASAAHQDLWGNVLQGTGNALLADTEKNASLGEVGNKIQAIGNVIIVIGFLISDDEKRVSELSIKGNLIQAVGGSLSITEVLNKDPAINSIYDVYGNMLQIVGNVMQSMSGIKDLHGIDSDLLDIVGGWTQAVGSVFTLIDVIKDK